MYVYSTYSKGFPAGSTYSKGVPARSLLVRTSCRGQWSSLCLRPRARTCPKPHSQHDFTFVDTELCYFPTCFKCGTYLSRDANDQNAFDKDTNWSGNKHPSILQASFPCMAWRRKISMLLSPHSILSSFSPFVPFLSNGQSFEWKKETEDMILIGKEE